MTILWNFQNFFLIELWDIFFLILTLEWPQIERIYIIDLILCQINLILYSIIPVLNLFQREIKLFRENKVNAWKYALNFFIKQRDQVKLTLKVNTWIIG